MDAAPAAGQPDVGFARFSRPVDDAADDRQRHRRRDVGEALLQRGDRLDDRELLPRAGWAGDDRDAAMAQMQRLEDLEAGLDLLHRVGRKRHADGVADPLGQQHADADGRFDRAPDESAGLGHADVQGVVARRREAAIGGDGEERVGRLDADLELAEVVVLQDAGVAERAFDHRLRAGRAVALQQVAFERARIDADPHGAAVVLRGPDDLAHPLRRADIARIDAQAGGAGLRGLDRAAVVKVDVGDDGDLGRAHDLRQRGGGLGVGAGDPHDVGARFLEGADLADGRLGVGRRRIGHRLHRDRRAAADGDRTHPDAPRAAPRDVAPGADAHRAAASSSASSAMPRTTCPSSPSGGSATPSTSMASPAALPTVRE